MKWWFARPHLRVVLSAVALNIGFGVGFYYAERGVQQISLPDSLWWAMVTMTTVGYGDLYAQTPIGRFLISYPCMILGIGMIGYLVGSVANVIIDVASKRRKGLMDIRLNDHVVICNFPGIDKVRTLIDELLCDERHYGRRMVIVDDVLSELPPELQKEEFLFVKGSPTDIDILARAGVKQCDGVFILARDPDDPASDERTFTITALIERLEEEAGRSIKTIAEVVREKNIRNVRQANADGVTSEDGVASRLLAQEYLFPGINGVIGQILSISMGSRLHLRPASMSGYRIRDLQIAALRHKSNVQVIGLIHGGESLLNPPPGTQVDRGDRLIVLAEDDAAVEMLEKEIMDK